MRRLKPLAQVSPQGVQGILVWTLADSRLYSGAGANTELCSWTGTGSGVGLLVGAQGMELTLERTNGLGWIQEQVYVLVWTLERVLGLKLTLERAHWLE